jgi:hypothetical protein
MAPEGSTSGLRPKYVPLSPEAWTRLDELARELQDAKSRRGGERITANTLIRVGVAVVLAYSNRLAGDTEEEIRSSLLELLSQAPASQADNPAPNGAA